MLYLTPVKEIVVKCESESTRKKLYQLKNAKEKTSVYWERVRNLEKLLSFKMGMKYKKVKVLMVRKQEETQENEKWENLENVKDFKIEKAIGKVSVHEENGKRNSYGET